MTRPVLITHGVANPTRERFDTGVARLRRELPDVPFVPVYWGDLGSNEEHLDMTLPDVRDREVRGAAAPDLVTGLELLPGHEVRHDGDRREVIADAADTTAHAGGEQVTADDVRAALDEVWGELAVLPAIRDEQVLRRAGELLAEAAAGRPPGGPTGHEVRGGPEVRGARSVLAGVVKQVDRLLSQVVGDVGGEMNRQMRRRLVPGMVGFAGDSLAYLHDKPAVQERFWQALEEDAPGWGTPEQPVAVAAHSLGGVIAFDLAVAAEDPLHVDGLVTFGSQSPWFHVVDPRATTLAAYTGAPVALPATIRGPWVNLWEPLDPLAFVASRVFRLADGSAPDDRMVPYETGSGLWTHSVYWERHQLVDAVREVLG